MNRIKRRLATAGLVTGGLLLSVGLAVANPASAYPPGTAMTVSAVQTSGNKPSVVVVNVAQVTPGCTVSVKATSGSASASGTSVTNGTGAATFTLTLAKASGSIKVTARTISCSLRESASTSVKVTNPKVSAPSSVRVNKWFAVSATGFPKNTAISFVATSGSTTVTVSGTTNSSGAVQLSMRLPTRGTWAIVAASGGKSASTVVKVTR